MNGIHDMGGMDGFGVVEVEENEPVFHERWEARVFGINLLALASGPANIDASRHAIERIEPDQYLTLGYYGRWLRALETRLVELGFLAEGELDARLEGRAVESPPPPPPGEPPSPNARREIASEPAFSVGQRVRTCNLQPRGHTRLPGYARARRGVVAIVHPAFVFPDTHAHGLGEQPEYVYSVRFEGRELWGERAEPSTCVHLDLFESYLEAET
ncbi:MAG: nitrile hydratase subunit beta [Myxococcota bacterium]